MARGYLASITNTPPLIFRFQFNPDLLSEKKGFKYNEANSFGKWEFDKTQAASGFLPTLKGFGDDLKEWGSLLVATKPLEADTGEQRSFSLEFVLDATTGPEDEGFEPRYGGSILPDLAVLRSFMNPGWDPIEVVKALFSKDKPCWNKPPECTLVYGGLSLSCVMVDLNIKMTAFFPDGNPSRAEISCTLKEQTNSYSTLTDFIGRYVAVIESYARMNTAQIREEDALSLIPGAMPISKLFE
jgi:hypothetical protein